MHVYHIQINIFWKVSGIITALSLWTFSRLKKMLESLILKSKAMWSLCFSLLMVFNMEGHFQLLGTDKKLSCAMKIWQESFS